MSMKELKCPHCGESNFDVQGTTCKCLICNTVFKDDEVAEIRNFMIEQAENFIGNLRFRLREETTKEIIDVKTVENLADNILNQKPDDVVAIYYKAFARRFRNRNGYKDCIQSLCGEEVKPYQAKQIAKTMIRFYELYVKEAISTFLQFSGIEADFSAELQKREVSYESDFEIKMPSITRDVLIVCDESDYATADNIVSFLEGKGLKCWFAPRNFDNATSNKRDFMKKVVASTKSALFINSAKAKKNGELMDLLFEIAEHQNEKNVCRRVILSPDSLSVLEDEFSRKAVVCRPEDGLRNVMSALKKDAKKAAEKEKAMRNITTMVNSGFYEKAKLAIEDRLLLNEADDEKELRLLLLKVTTKEVDTAAFRYNLTRLKDLCSAEEMRKLEEEFPCIVNYEKLFNEAKSVLSSNVNEGIKLLEKVAKSNHKDANYELGELYFFGKVVPKDIKKAVSYYEVAARNGHGDANRKLGVLYDMGRMIEKNDDKAFKYYLEGAKLGIAFCCRKVAEFYADDSRHICDKEEAFRWYKEGAKKEDPDSVYELSHCYKYGKGTAQNQVYADKCLKYAAEKMNHPKAKSEHFGH